MYLRHILQHYSCFMYNNRFVFDLVNYAINKQQQRISDRFFANNFFRYFVFSFVFFFQPNNWRFPTVVLDSFFAAAFIYIKHITVCTIFSAHFAVRFVAKSTQHAAYVQFSGFQRRQTITSPSTPFISSLSILLQWIKILLD